MFNGEIPRIVVQERKRSATETMNRIEMNFTDALRAYDTHTFRDALIGQLEKHYSAFPLGSGCKRGGYPQTGAAITVRDVVANHERITVDVTIRFAEAFSSGCSEAPSEELRWVDCRVSIQRVDGSATIETVEPERPEEF